MPKTVSKLYKTLLWGEEVSLAALDTTALVNEAIVRHKLLPVAAAALGRTMTAAAYLCSWLKDGQSSLSVSISGGGPGGKLAVVGDGQLRMRGYIENPSVSLPPRADGKLDVGGCVGREGTLTVVRDDGEGVPFVGTSPLVSGEIAEDFSAYFLTSEQRPTAIALGVKIGTDGMCLGAGGVFLQPLPDASEENIVRTEETISRFSSVSSLIEKGGAKGIFEMLGAVPADPREIYFRCHCSADRAARAVLSLGRADAEALLKEEGIISVHCQYCNTAYRFAEKDLDAIFRGSEKNEGQ